jgi:hypothetical protein
MRLGSNPGGSPREWWSDWHRYGLIYWNLTNLYPRVSSKYSESPDGDLADYTPGITQNCCQLAHEKHLAIYIVGGFVTRSHFDRPVLIWYRCWGDAIALAQSLCENLGRVTTHHRFGTAKSGTSELDYQ